MAKISVLSFNNHLSRNGFRAVVDESGTGQQFHIAFVNISRNNSFHQGGPVLSYCKAYKENGRYVMRSQDVIAACTQLRITPPKRDEWDA